MNGKQLDKHGKHFHTDGFSSPVGKLKGIATPIEAMVFDELIACGIVPGRSVTLEFESGITVHGVVKTVHQDDDERTYMITFEDCTVKESNGNVLFQPDWGVYDMAIGENIVSVFNGAADKDAYEEITHVSEQQTHKIVYDEKTEKLHQIYRQVRAIREGHEPDSKLGDLFEALRSEHRYDWLAALEILEILYHRRLNTDLEKEVRIYLELKSANEPDHKKLINDGLHVIHNPVAQLITEED